MSMTGVEEVNIWQAALRAVLEEFRGESRALSSRAPLTAWRTRPCEGRLEASRFCPFLSNKLVTLPEQLTVN